MANSAIDNTRRWNTLFSCFLVMAVFAALICHGIYITTSAIFSDLAVYGIRHGTPAYQEIVLLTQRQVLLFATPIIFMLILASFGWWGTLCALRRIAHQLNSAKQDEIRVH